MKASDHAAVMTELSVTQLDAMAREGSTDYDAFTSHIRATFSSTQALLSGYSYGSGVDQKQSRDECVRVDVDAIRQTITLLGSTGLVAGRLLNSVGEGLTSLLQNRRCWANQGPHKRAQLFFIVLGISRLLHERGNCNALPLLWRRLGHRAQQLHADKEGKLAVASLQKCDLTWIGTLVSAIHSEIERIILSGHHRSDSVSLCASILELLYAVNLNQRAQGSPSLPAATFCNHFLLAHSDLKREYRTWKRGGFRSGTVMSQPAELFSILQFSFLIDPNAKARMLRIDAVLQMSRMIQDAVVHQAWIAQAKRLSAAKEGDSTALEHAASPYLVLEIRRDFLIEDSLRQVMPIFRSVREHCVLNLVEYIGRTQR